MDYHVVGSQAARRRRCLPSRDPRCRVSRADRPLCRGVRRCRDPARRDRRRGVRAAACGRAPDRLRATTSAPQSSRSRSVTTARRSRSPTASICDFTRVLEWGGGRLDAAIARELGVTTDEATEIKLGLSPRRTTIRRPPVLANAVKNELTTLARELVASLQFYQAQPDSLALSEILVTGGTTRMPGLVEELERLVRARVRLADPLSAVQADARRRRPATTSRRWRSRSDWGWSADGRRQSPSARISRAEAQASLGAGSQPRRASDAPRRRWRRPALRRAARRSLSSTSADREQQEEGAGEQPGAIAAVQPQVDAVKAAQSAVSGRLSLAQSIASTRMNWDKALNDFATSSRRTRTCRASPSRRLSRGVCGRGRRDADDATFDRFYRLDARWPPLRRPRRLDNDAVRRRPQHAGCRTRNGPALSPALAERRHA